MANLGYSLEFNDLEDSPENFEDESNFIEMLCGKNIRYLISKMSVETAETIMSVEAWRKPKFLEKLNPEEIWEDWEEMPLMIEHDCYRSII